MEKMAILMNCIMFFGGRESAVLPSVYQSDLESSFQTLVKVTGAQVCSHKRNVVLKSLRQTTDMEPLAYQKERALVFFAGLRARS